MADFIALFSDEDKESSYGDCDDSTYADDSEATSPSPPGRPGPSPPGRSGPGAGGAGGGGLRRGDLRSRSATDLLVDRGSPGVGGPGRSNRFDSWDKMNGIIDMRRGDATPPGVSTPSTPATSPQRRRGHSGAASGGAASASAGRRSASAPRLAVGAASVGGGVSGGGVGGGGGGSISLGGSQPLPSPPDRSKGDVSVCARLRPGPRHEMCIYAETPNCVRFRPLAQQGRRDMTYRPEDTYWCDHAFGPEATQDQVFANAVAPTCEAVLEGYNGAVIAYGQTGSGKTFTIIGDAQNRGVIPRAVTTVFSALQKRKRWSVEVSVLEIYNERARDLLAPGQCVTQVDIHELPGASSTEGMPCFACPDATRREVRTPEEALTSLFEGLRKRETAFTDMNHSSSRSHLIYTLTVTQTDDALQATLRGRLHLVDLAGCERLKRSMASELAPGNGFKTPRERDSQRREAGAINKSLTQLALVIHRLTQPVGSGVTHVPYRDSMLTRLLSDSFGGSSKTCLIINCSPLLKDRDETKQALEFGKRANLVKNVAEINIDIKQEPSEIVKALVARELKELKREQGQLRAQVREAARDAMSQQKRRADEVRKLEKENELLRKQVQSMTSAAVSVEKVSEDEVVKLRNINGSLQQRVEALLAEVMRMQGAKKAIHLQLAELLAQSERVDEAAPPALVDEARTALAQAKSFAEELASRPEMPTPSAAIRAAAAAVSTSTGSSGEGGADSDGCPVTSDSRARARLREQRLAGLEADARALQDRWGEMLADPECEEENAGTPEAGSPAGNSEKAGSAPGGGAFSPTARGGAASAAALGAAGAGGAASPLNSPSPFGGAGGAGGALPLSGAPSPEEQARRLLQDAEAAD